MSSSQDKVLTFIKNFQIAYPGVSPSYREILDAVNRTSTGGLRITIDGLESSGEVEKYDTGSSRGLILPDTVLITREIAEQLGLDWYELKNIQLRARNKMDRQLQRKPMSMVYQVLNGQKVTA